jgi:hypothetical protein
MFGVGARLLGLALGFAFSGSTGLPFGAAALALDFLLGSDACCFGMALDLSLGGDAHFLFSQAACLLSLSGSARLVGLTLGFPLGRSASFLFSAAAHHTHHDDHDRGCERETDATDDKKLLHD